MALRQTEKGWEVDVRPEGAKGRRVRKTFLTKAEALRFEAFIRAETGKGKPWNPLPADRRRLFELIELWYQQHGQHLKDGARRKRKLLALAQKMDNPIGSGLRPESYLSYRQRRAADGIHAKTLNNELGYLNAVFNELHRTQQIPYPNPLSSVRPIKLRERELSFLSLEQIRELLDTIERTSENPHVLLITKLCLATGCRWGEAERLKRQQIRMGQVSFIDTKSGRNRTVPISEDLEQDLLRHDCAEGRNGELFDSSIGAFRRALAKTTIELPAGQATHVLRHSFASHFIVNGGDILVLQKILGHSSLFMTMRYAHLAPTHLSVCKEFNPLSVSQRKSKASA